jgi:oxygen-independent coproporphyrinogen III oxidase
MNCGIYIHIPFCQQNCKYCHFVTCPVDMDLVEKYQAAVINEIITFDESRMGIVNVDSLYFGGGTPSIIPEACISKILEACRNRFILSKACEITIEANPDTIRRDKFVSYRKSGINRISIGAQSFQNNELAGIGRIHNAETITESVELLKEIGFINLNLDLLIGLPMQTARSWNETLQHISILDLAHVSVYMLDLDEPCELSELVAAGYTSIPDDDVIADLYLEAVEILDSYGYLQYEISNFARPGFSCRHNLKYWQRRPVIGFGLASHSFDGHIRYANQSEMSAYLHSVGKGHMPVAWENPVEEKQALEETLILGLRLKEGIQWPPVQPNLYAAEWVEIHEEFFRKWSDEGLLEWKDSLVRLTPAGMLLSNELFQKFI